MTRLAPLVALLFVLSGFSKLEATIFHPYKQAVAPAADAYYQADVAQYSFSEEVRVQQAKNPVSVMLRGARLPDAAILRWVITDAGEAKSQTLERSADGFHFKPIRRLELTARGYTDAQPIDAAWYRICLTTKSNKIVYSSIVYLAKEEDLLTDQ